MNIKQCIGAIVMAGSSLVAVSAQAAVATTPEQAVKNYFSAVEKGDQESFTDSVYFPEIFTQLPAEKANEIKQQMFQEMQASLKKEGGMKSLDIAKAQEGADSNHMSVHIRGTTHNGETQEADVPVVKVGQGWKIGQ